MGVIDRSAEGLVGGYLRMQGCQVSGRRGRKEGLVEWWSRGSGSGILGGERGIGE